MKKRIALVVNTLSGGGAEKTVSNLSRVLSGYYDIDIIVNDTEHLEYPYRGRIVSLNMTTGQGNAGSLYQLLVVFKRIRVLRRLKREQRYAAVISFSDMCNVSNVLSGNRYGKTIVSVRNSLLGEKDASRLHRLFAPLLMPWCYRTADLTVSCSKGICDELRENYALPAEKGKVICNGLELALIRKKAGEPLKPTETEEMEGKKIIVCVGRLTGQKGHRYLLKSIKVLRDEKVPVRLIILGEGELRNSLEEQTMSLGIAKDVMMPGFCRNPYKYMAHADVVVMPSLYEGFSNVLLEALACGAPVVSTDHETGAREILAPDTDYRKKVTDRIDEAKYGILVPVFKPDADYGREPDRSHERMPSEQERLMADAIRRMIFDPNLAKHYREAALERAEQMDIKSIGSRWINIIEG